MRALGRLGRRAGQQAAEALIRALDDPEAHVTFLDEVVKALGDIDNNALTDWVITRTAKGFGPQPDRPDLPAFPGTSRRPRELRPKLLEALAEVTTRAERGTRIGLLSRVYTTCAGQGLTRCVGAERTDTVR